MNPAPPPPKPIRRVMVVAKMGTPEGARLASELGAWLGARGVEYIFEEDTARAVGSTSGIPLGDLPSETDLALVAGGDGTLLWVARSAAPRDIPLLGINLGSLGFLTELQPDEAFSGLERVLLGEYQIELRKTLRVRYVPRDNQPREYALLNDAVVTKSALARMIRIDVHVDGEYVVSYTSDGLIVSTPTGSTAYSLSAGGPILDPRMSAFVIAPICPHTMSHRPLVVPGDVSLDVSLHSDGEEVYLTLDGQIGFPMQSEDSLKIDNHPNPVRLVRVAGRGFFEILRRKLRWGER